MAEASVIGSSCELIRWVDRYRLTEVNRANIKAAETFPSVSLIRIIWPAGETPQRGEPGRANSCERALPSAIPHTSAAMEAIYEGWIRRE